MKQILIAGLMLAHHAAFLEKLGACGVYECRDEPTLGDIAKTLDGINTAFEEYKATNDARIKAIADGKGTSELDAKLAKMDEHIESLNEQKKRLETLQQRANRPGAGATGADAGEPEAEAYKSAFISWARNPTDHQRTALMQQRSKDLHAAIERRNAAMGIETRATQAVTSTGSAGGFALPEFIEQQIARLSVDISPIRQIATVRPVGTPDYKELFDINGAGFEWVGETDTRAQTSTPDMAEVAPTFGMASAKPQASEESLDDLFFDVENWLISSAVEAMSQGEGAAFVSGNGTKKPTGFLAGPTPVTTTDASRAFGTLQYIASGQAAALPTSPDLFIDMIYSLRARYRANAQWVTNKLVLAALRKYKDSQNQYLWQPPVAAGQPSTFLGYGITEAEDMPAVAANAFPLAFGDFREGYLICDRVGMRMTRDEITTPGFVKFYIRKRVGGKLRNTQAIKLLKVAAA